jgi:hypothetical protein
MSFSGKFTPLQLNLIGELSSDRGFKINDDAKTYQGTWTPTGYTQGSLTNSSVLNKWTTSVKKIYEAVAADVIIPGTPATTDPDNGQPIPGTPDTHTHTDITTATYRNLLVVGQSTCPALANTRPLSFKGSHAGYGSWKNNKKVFNNYPPKKYANTVNATTASYSWVYQQLGEYAYVTGWPGQNSWQKKDSSGSYVDTYKLAAPGSTAFQGPGISGSTKSNNINDYDEYFSTGFISTIARQAYYEYWTGQENQYNTIINALGMSDGYKSQQNEIISSYVNTKSFMTGTYSNINDLTTSNISGVNTAFKVWGNDLIKTGRAIDLSNISSFGLPSVLLRTLQSNNVLTTAVKMALTWPADKGGGGLTTQELEKICRPTYEPTRVQEQKIYTAFTLIQGNDLATYTNGTLSGGILYGINCTTSGITSLADLLDPKKLFPNSFNSLTIPRFNAERSVSTSSKIYDFIYVNGGSNGRIQNWGSYLDGILSTELTIVCGAFAMTMQQIPGISSMLIEKFSQVVANLELTNYGLPLINTTNGIPTDVATINNMLDLFAMGSGNSGAYRQCDFNGAMSGYPYVDYYKIVLKLINQLPTGTLSTLYSQVEAMLNNQSLMMSGANSTLNSLIDQINTEITNIKNANPGIVDQINYYWSAIGNQLYIEQRALPMAIQDAQSITEQYGKNDITNYVKKLEDYAKDTSDGQMAPILLSIADTATLGGQSLIAAMREARNAELLTLANAPTSLNDVSSSIDICAASAKAIITNGSITSVKIINGSSGYNTARLPTIYVYPIGLGAVLKPVLATDGSISSITVVSGGKNYTDGEVVIEIDSPPKCLPTNQPQQHYGDTAYSQLVSPQLTTPASASPDVTTAISDVTTCNCDCWTA